MPAGRFAEVPVLFFGIGAQKAGTTWLHRYLQTHPDVSTPALKETTYWNYVETGQPHAWTRARADRFGAGRGVLPALLRRFGSPFPSLRPDEMQIVARMLDTPSETHEHYADLMFNNYRGETAMGEISPNYALLGSDTFARMSALSERVRFFYAMRDPVSRTVSALRMALSRGWLRSRGIATLGDALDDALAAPDTAYAIRSSRYDRAVARLEAAVPRARIHYMFYETLFEQESADRLTDFLGVARHAAPTETRVLKGRQTGERPSASQVAALRAALDETYEFVADRFGTEAAPGWRF